MKFGVYLNTQAPPAGADRQRVYAEALELAQVAEQVGLDACFIPEHHQQPDAYLPSPLVMAGAIAAVTSRIQINTGILVLPIWHPLRVAEDAAVVDVLSGGRLGLGLGLGLVDREYRQFGVVLKDAVSRMEEEVQVLKLAFAEDRFSFHGRHFTFDDVRLAPRPIQSPRPPLWLGAMSEPAVERAGRLGDGWISDPLHNLESIRAWARRYRAVARAAGSPEWIWLQRDIWVADDPAEIERDWAPHLVNDWRFYFFSFGSFKRFHPEFEPWIREVVAPEQITFDRLREDRVIVGMPDQVASELQRWTEAVGPDGICFRLRFPHGPSHARTLRALRLFGEQVIPEYRALGAGRPIGLPSRS